MNPELESLLGTLVVKNKGFFGGLVGVLIRKDINGEVNYFVDFNGSLVAVTSMQQITKYEKQL